MNALILGKSGQVARALQAELASRNRSAAITSSRAGADHFLDLGNLESIEQFFAHYAAQNPKKSTEVYLPGAMTHVDRCETERDLCRRVNVLGPIRVAQLCAELGYPLCFYSSEYVYGEDEYHGGKLGPFQESDPANPSSFYGACKLEVEKALAAMAQLDFLVLRTTMVFSFDAQGMNFFMQLYRFFVSIEKGESVNPFKIPIDQISTPTYAPALAKASVDLMESRKTGIYHIVGKDLLSRKAFAKALAEAFGFSWAKLEPHFIFLKTKELAQVARRPLTAGLKADKASSEGIRIWNLAEAFAAIRQTIEETRN